MKWVVHLEIGEIFLGEEMMTGRLVLRSLGFGLLWPIVALPVVGATSEVVCDPSGLDWGYEDLYTLDLFTEEEDPLCGYPDGKVDRCGWGESAAGPNGRAIIDPGLDLVAVY
ncbi:MAG: hypothetical protein KDD47_20350, partial [Acidobacteria bacterium]|nr:hypothetical protein [Acidobacteriota bacterium]